MRKRLLLMMLLLLPMVVSRAKTEINGIFYNLNSSNKTAMVTSGANKYIGSVSIPMTVNYNDEDYSVTSIGDASFSGCSGLTSVTIPSSVTSIGGSAFYGCSGLTSVTIPSSVTIIASAAFYNCSGLTSITIPRGVTSIGDFGFYNCSGLTSIIIPCSVTSIGLFAFGSCRGLTSATIPNSVTNIGRGLFEYCYSLASVTLPNSVTSIKEYTFLGCSGLTDIYSYGDEVLTTYANSFNNSNINNATLHVPASLVEAYKTTAPWNEFKEVVALGAKEAYAVLSTDNTTLTFYYDERLGSREGTVYTLDGSPHWKNWVRNGSCEGSDATCFVCRDGDYADGIGVNRITDGVGINGSRGVKVHTIETAEHNYNSDLFVYTPDHVWNTGDRFRFRMKVRADKPGHISAHSESTPGVFVGTILDSGYDITTEWQEIMYEGIIVEGFVSEAIQTIAFRLNEQPIDNNYYFDDIVWESLTTYQFGDWSEYKDYVTTVVFDNSFAEYDGIESIDSWFMNFAKLESILGMENFNVASIGFQTFCGCCGLTSVIIPNSVTSIDRHAFLGCNSLVSVTIPNSVTNIGSAAFKDCSGLKSLIIPNSVTSIGYYAFRGCSGLTSVTIPNSVTSIGGYAFYECSSLMDVFCKADQIPTTQKTPFNSSMISNATLHVPASAVDAYSSTAPWSDFGTIVPIEDEDDLQSYLNSLEDTEDSFDGSTYRREFLNDDWQALYVPFEMNYSDWSAEFEVARVSGFRYDYSGLPTGLDGGILEATMVESGKVEANYPYLIRAKSKNGATLELNVTGTVNKVVRTVSFNPIPNNSNVSVKIRGNYSNIQKLKSDRRARMRGSVLSVPNTDTEILPPYRWYISSPEIQAARMVIEINGEEVTAISTAYDTHNKPAVYDLQGRRMKNLQSLPSGVYIINNKKCIVK